MDGVLDEIGFLARSEHRTATLDALAERPRDRRDLCRATGASAATMSRILSAFQERRWIVEDGHAYAVTPLGDYVARRFASFREAMAVERELRDVWRWLPREMEGFTVDLFADAVVSYPGPGYPYQPVERVRELIEETTTMRGFGTTVFKSVTNETVCRRILDGMKHEYIYAPQTLAATIAWDPARVAEAAACENCTVLVHDDLPDRVRCGLGIFDDRAAICCHDPETGMLEAVVDTGAPEARRWALDVFAEHRAEARPLSGEEKAELFPDSVLA